MKDGNSLLVDVDAEEVMMPDDGLVVEEVVEFGPDDVALVMSINYDAVCELQESLLDVELTSLLLQVTRGSVVSASMAEIKDCCWSHQDIGEKSSLSNETVNIPELLAIYVISDPVIEAE